ncbi:MAG: hypothetical protein LBL38_02725 [Lactobacillales bacterium]|jgi:hypothetical protein|nr:hypothetical protein [Lactobacillales bacterium]
MKYTRLAKKYSNFLLLMMLSFLYIIYTNTLIKRLDILKYFQQIPHFAEFFSRQRMILILDILQIITLFIFILSYCLITSFIVGLTTKVRLTLSLSLKFVLISQIFTVFFNILILNWIQITKIKQALFVSSLPISIFIICSILAAYLKKKQISIKEILEANGLLLIIWLMLTFIGFKISGCKL